MVVNFRARGISRGACKLARTSTLKKKKKKKKINEKLIVWVAAFLYNKIPEKM
jgi:hypothetical protein